MNNPQLRVRSNGGAKRSGTKQVVIVGGGLAGLSAAEALTDHYPNRFAVHLLEAKQVVGGRAGSFTDPTSGETVDYCQHVTMGCCTNLIGLLTRTGLLGQFHRYGRLLFLHPDYPPSPFVPQRLPAPLHLAGALRGLRFLKRVQLRQVQRAMWRLFRTSPQSLSDQTAHEWLRAAGQDSQTIRDFWDVILVSALGERPEVVSMAVARKVFVDGFAGAPGASDILVPRLPLADLFGNQLRQVIESRGVTVLTRRKVRHVQSPPQAVVETQDGDVFRADHVIVAVPWHAIGGLLSEQLLPNIAAYNEIPTSPISGLHLWLDRQVTDQAHAVMVGTISQWLFTQPWDDAARRPGEHYYQVVISASQQARQVPKDQLVQRVMAEIRHAFPAARDANVVRSRIVTDPNSVFSVRPQVERLRPPAATAHRWLHLAGDWIATGWPATMEGAVIGGRMAAASVGEQEGLPPVGLDPGLPRGWLARQLIK